MRVGDRIRSTRDGQIGFLAEDEAGALVVRLDRPAEKRTVPYRASEWAADKEPRLTGMQVARILFEADTALRAVQGEYGLTSWLGTKDQQKQPWLNGPPSTANALRKKLYLAIRGVFE